MNIFNKVIYSSHLEHSQKGQTWGKHKYLYITETGRYVYPEDVANGKSQQQFRKRQINDQIKSAHVGSTAPTRHLAGTSGATQTPSGKKIYWKTDRDGINKSMGVYAAEIKRNNTSSVKKQEAAKTSGVAAGSNKVSTPVDRNTIMIKKIETPTSTKTEEKKTETTETTETKDGDKYKNMSEEMKEYLRKNAGKEEKKDGKYSGKKGSGGKKKSGGSGKKSSTSKASTKTEEATKLGLTDDDLKNMEVNTDATDREEVLKNIALKVIRGDYGNGSDRKAKLGTYYDEVQKRVNELLKSGQVQRQGSSGKSSNANSVAKELSDMSGMKTSATQKLIKLYEDEGASSEKFKKELSILAEGDPDQEKAMIAVMNKAGIKSKKKTTAKHSDSLRIGAYLEHYGIKRRSGRFPFGSGERPRQHEARNHSWRDRRTMSNEELKEAVNRARLELDLYNNERNNRSATQKFVEDVLTSVGKSVIIGAASGALKYAGKQFVSKSLENPDLANAMFGGGGGGGKKKKKK